MDAGVGKTFAALGYCDRTDRQKILIVCPTTLKTQWKKEISRFTQGEVTVIEGGRNDRKEQWKNSSRFTVVNYDTLSDRKVPVKDSNGLVMGYEKRHGDVFLAKDIKWDAVILDESHRINSPVSSIYKAIRQIDSPCRMALSGDPFPNGLHEAFSVVDWVNPQVLGSNFYVFRAYWCKSHPVFPSKIIGYKDESRLKQIIARHFFRAHMTEQPKQETTYEWVELTSDETKLYDKMSDELRIVVQGMEKVTIPNLLSLLMRKRQLVDAPETLDQSLTKSSKRDRLKELIGKSDEKTIVFTEFKSLVKLLVGEYGERAAVITGDLSVSEKDEQKNKFESNPDCNIMLSTSAGNYGLNLQCATRVIHYGVPWNKARLNQRLARARRKGQTRTVKEIYVLAKGTVDEAMLKIVDRKDKMNRSLEVQELKKLIYEN